jgi:hypothetical protein
MIKISGFRVNKINNICEIFFEGKKIRSKKKSNKIMPIHIIPLMDNFFHSKHYKKRNFICHKCLVFSNPLKNI